jgi:hypothetical protein
MTLRLATLLAATCCLTFLGAAAVAGSSPAVSDPEAAKDTPKEFSIEVKAVELHSGAKASATLSIIAAKGFKWNKEYPAKVTFEGQPKYVSLAKVQFKQMGGDFKTSEKRADVSVAMTGKSAGQEILKAKAKFSVCNDTVCVIREASFNVSVHVTR